MADEQKLPDINAQLLFELGVTNLNWQKICDYFAIPKKARYNPNCSDWIIKWIKEAEHIRQNKRPDEMFGGTATPETTLSDGKSET